MFLIAEHRAQHPTVPLALFRSRRVVITLSVAFITMAGFYGTVFLQSLYFQQQRGYSALATGLLFFPMTGLVALTNPLVSKIADRFGRILPIIAGQVGMASGLLVLAAIPLHAPALAVAVVMILVGVGGAFTVPPIASLILDSVPGQLGGTASGVTQHLPEDGRFPWRRGLRRGRQRQFRLRARVASQFRQLAPDFRQRHVHDHRIESDHEKACSA